MSSSFLSAWKGITVISSRNLIVAVNSLLINSHRNNNVNGHFHPAPNYGSRLSSRSSYNLCKLEVRHITHKAIFLLSRFFDGMVRKGAFHEAVWTCNKQYFIESMNLFICSNRRGAATALYRCSLCLCFLDIKYTFQKAHRPSCMILNSIQGMSKIRNSSFSSISAHIVDSCMQSQEYAWSMMFLELLT